jgi:hypothetical protein
MSPFGVATTQQSTTSQPQPSCSKPHWAPIGFDEAARLLFAAKRFESAQDAVVFLGKQGISLCRDESGK